MTSLVKLARRHAEPCVHLWRTNPGAFRGYGIIAMLTFSAGVGLLFGTPTRFNGPTYRAINEIGGPDWFGVTFLVLFVWLVAGVFATTVLRWGLLADSALFGIVGLSFGTAVWNDDNAGPLSPLFCIAAALWCVSQAELYRRIPVW